MSESKVVKQLNQYARKRHVLIVRNEGLTVDNLYDAKDLVKKFGKMAVNSGQSLLSDVVESPETGISLMMFWANRSQMNFKQLEEAVDVMNLDQKLEEEGDIAEQVGSLNLMLGNLIDKLPVDKLIVDRVGNGTGTIVLSLYEVEYIDADDGYDKSHFDLVLYTCQIGIASFWDKNEILQREYWKSDYLGGNREEAEENLLKHEWLQS